MKNIILPAVVALWLQAWAASADQNIHTFLQWWDGETYASTFAKDASRAMDLESSFEWEVCWATRVSDLPEELQDIILTTWGDVEQVRECTRRAEVMDDI